MIRLSYLRREVINITIFIGNMKNITFHRLRSTLQTWVQGVTFEDLSMVSAKCIGHFSGPGTCIKGLVIRNVTVGGSGSWGGCSGVDLKSAVVDSVLPPLTTSRSQEMSVRQRQVLCPDTGRCRGHQEPPALVSAGTSERNTACLCSPWCTGP